VGSDVLWSSRFRGRQLCGMDTCSFRFWQRKRHGAQHIEVSSERGTPGTYARRLTVSALQPTRGIGFQTRAEWGFANSGLLQCLVLPPQSVTVGVYWVIMNSACAWRSADPRRTVRRELDQPSAGVMSLRIYDIENGDLPVLDGICGCICATRGPGQRLVSTRGFHPDADDSTGHLTSG